MHHVPLQGTKPKSSALAPRAVLFAPWFPVKGRALPGRNELGRGVGARWGQDWCAGPGSPAGLKASPSLPCLSSWRQLEVCFVPPRGPAAGGLVYGAGCIFKEKQGFFFSGGGGGGVSEPDWKEQSSFQELTASSSLLYCQILINTLSYGRNQCVIKSLL